VTTSDVLGYLQSKGLLIRRAGGHEVQVPCFYHGATEGDRGKLYINVDPNAEIPGLHFCHVCEKRGSLVSLQKHFGDYESGKVVDDSHVKHEILNFAAAYYHQRLGENEEAFMWLRGPDRGLASQTIMDAKLGYSDGTLWWMLREAGFSARDVFNAGLFIDGDRPIEALRGFITIPYFVAGNCVMIRGRAYPHDGSGPKYKTVSGQKARAFNTDAVWGAEELVCSEGEFDALVLSQLGFQALGIPGVTAWNDSWKGYFEGARRVWILFDSDAPGLEGARRLRDRIGPNARIVKLPDGADVTSWVQEGHNALELKQLMEASRRTGVLVTVEEAYEEHSEVQGQTGLRLGYEQLDALIEPGLLPGQVAIVLAKTSVGKTLFLLNVMQRATMVPGQEDLRFLFVSLEQTRGEWYERARRIAQFHDLQMPESQVREFWRKRLMLTDKNRLSEPELRTALDDFEEEMGSPPDLLVVDYLGYWAQSFAGERYQRTSDAVMALKAVAKDRRVPVLAPHQVSRTSRQGEEPDMDGARESGVVDETADFLFTLWSPDNQLGKAQEERTGTIYLRIAKSRHGSRGMKLRFQFAPICLAMVPHGDAEARMAQRELDWERSRLPFEEAIARHRRYGGGK
jgi:KaiC/GvpD/RAD55 family RecA-like ATPase